MSGKLWYLHLRVGILFQARVLSAEQISTACKMLAHRRTSIPHRLGPLPSECYTTTFVRTHHRASIPHRLGPLPCKCYSMVSTYECRNTLHISVLFASRSRLHTKFQSHHRALLPLRLGPLLSEFYSTISTNECGYSPCESHICRAILIKDQSHEQFVIHSILKRGYYRPQVNVIPSSSLSSIIDVSFIITPPFLGSFILSTCSPFV